MIRNMPGNHTTFEIHCLEEMDGPLTEVERATYPILMASNPLSTSRQR